MLPIVTTRTSGRRGRTAATSRCRARSACPVSWRSTQGPRWISISRQSGQPHRFRLVVVPGRANQTSRLCTNLARTAFSSTLVARLYRFRWQLARCFKEWKSYANLLKFDTANPHIASGLIWTSLCAAILKRFLAHAAQRVGGGTALSTRRVAMCAHLLLAAIVEALLRGRGLLTALQQAMQYLLANARRSDVSRERTTGRLRAGLVLVGGA